MNAIIDFFLRNGLPYVCIVLLVVVPIYLILLGGKSNVNDQ